MRKLYTRPRTKEIVGDQHQPSPSFAHAVHALRAQNWGWARYTQVMNLITYKKATLKYTVLETLEAGVSLIGSEVKSLRGKLGSLDGARVVVRDGEAFIIGMTIPPYQVVNTKKGYDPERARRLLLNKREIAELAAAEVKKSLTVIPLSMYNTHGLIKAKIAIVHGKNKVDKREVLKKREAVREAERALKGNR